MKKMEKFLYISMVNFKISLVENQYLPFRSSRWQVFFQVRVLKSYAIFVGKQQRRSLFFKKCHSFRPATATLLKRNSNEGVFLWILQSFFRRTLPVAAPTLPILFEIITEKTVELQETKTMFIVHQKNTW